MSVSEIRIAAPHFASLHAGYSVLPYEEGP
jgi:hypothetical protein